MTVFAVNETHDDISDARRFGTIRYINHRYVNGDELKYVAPDDRNALPDAFAANLRKAVSDFNPEEDFVLIVGDHLQMCALLAQLGARYPGIHVLRYDRREHSYIPVWLYSGLVPSTGPVVGSSSDIGHADIGTENGQERPQDQAFTEDCEPNEKNLQRFRREEG